MCDAVVLDISPNSSGGATQDDVATSPTQVRDCDPWSIWLHNAGKTLSRLISCFMSRVLSLTKC